MDCLNKSSLLGGKILGLLLAEDAGDLHGRGGLANQGRHTHPTASGWRLLSTTS